MYENLIKVVGGITASRDPVPPEIYGLDPVSLLDLTWVDPSLGFYSTVWWPEEIVPQTLPLNHKFTDEIFTIVIERQVVKVEREIVALTQEEIDVRDNAIKDAILNRVAYKRYQQELLGCVWQGHFISTDDRNRIVITELRAEALADPLYSAVYKTKEGFVLLSNSDINSLASAVRKYIQDCFDREYALYQHVQTWTYEESMLNEGWPSFTN